MRAPQRVCVLSPQASARPPGAGGTIMCSGAPGRDAVYVPLIRRTPMTEYRCPNGHLVATELADEATVMFGDPEPLCRECGALASVPVYREWTALTSRERIGEIVGVAIQSVIFGGAIGVIVGAAAVVTIVVLDGPEPVAIAALWCGIAGGMLLYPARFALKVVASLERVERRREGALPSSSAPS